MKSAFDATHERWAERVVDHEREVHAATAAEAGVRAYEKIFERFAPIVGRTGVRAVYARSVELAKRDVAALRDLAIDDEPIAAARPLVQTLGAAAPELAHAAVVTALATFIGLLATFLGHGLTTQILRAAWPELDFDPKETT